MRLDGEMGERKRIKKKKKVHICQKSSSRLSPPRDHRLHLDAEQKTANILGRRGKGRGRWEGGGDCVATCKSGKVSVVAVAAAGQHRSVSAAAAAQICEYRSAEM